MIDDNTIQAIQADIKLLDPEADERVYKARQKALQRHKMKYEEYQRNRKKQKYQYQPVVQSPSDHDDIDYDVL